MVTFDKDRPNSASEKHHSYTRAGGTPFNCQRMTTVVKKPRDMDIFCDDFEHPDCRQTRVEQDVVRQRQIERDRSDVSVR